MNTVKTLKTHRKKVNSFQEHANSVRPQLKGGLGETCTGVCQLKWNVPKWNHLEFKTFGQSEEKSVEYVGDPDLCYRRSEKQSNETKQRNAQPSRFWQLRAGTLNLEGFLLKRSNEVNYFSEKLYQCFQESKLQFGLLTAQRTTTPKINPLFQNQYFSKQE